MQASSERDVRRVQERNKLEEEKQLLERSLPWLEAEEGRKRYDEAKKAEAGWAAEVSKRKKEAEEASAPMKCVRRRFHLPPLLPPARARGPSALALRAMLQEAAIQSPL